MGRGARQNSSGTVRLTMIHFSTFPWSFGGGGIGAGSGGGAFALPVFLGFGILGIFGILGVVVVEVGLGMAVGRGGGLGGFGFVGGGGYIGGFGWRMSGSSRAIGPLGVLRHELERVGSAQVD